MDELTPLREFRADAGLPPEARAEARRALGAAVAGRRRRSRWVLALAAALALVGAGAAYALAREFLVGDPAPTAVEDEVALLTRVRGELLPSRRPGVVVRAEETRLGAKLQAPTGPVYLWVAPGARGEYCFTQIVGTELPDGRPNLSGGGCALGGRTFAATATGSRVRDRCLTVLHGQGARSVRRLEARYDGRRLPIPLSGRFFLTELPGIGERGLPELTVVALDAERRELGRQTFGRFPIPRPLDLTGERPVLEILTRRTRKPIRLYALDGCVVLVTPGGTSRGCGGRPIRPREIPIGPTQIGSAPTGMVLLDGEVGRAIARLELRFEDGRVERLPLVRGFTLYQVAPRDLAEGRRPVELVGRNEAGAIVARRPLAPR